MCVFIFPKDNQLPRPLSSQHTQTQHRCPNTRTLLEESFYFFIWAPVGACLRCSAPSSSLFFSSSSLSCSSLLLLLLLSPLALPLSHSLGFRFFFLLFNLVQVVSDGGTGAALPSPRSFSNNTVSILMLIWLLQPPQHRFCLFRFLFILCLFYVFIRRAKHSGGGSRRSSAGRERKRNERGHAQKYRERRREGKAEREGGGKSRGGKGISAAAAASKPLCFRRCFSWRMVELPKGCRGRVLVL